MKISTTRRRTRLLQQSPYCDSPAARTPASARKRTSHFPPHIQVRPPHRTYMSGIQVRHPDRLLRSPTLKENWWQEGAPASPHARDSHPFLPTYRSDLTQITAIEVLIKTQLLEENRGAGMVGHLSALSREPVICSSHTKISLQRRLSADPGTEGAQIKL